MRVLLAGETAVVHTLEIVGNDTVSAASYVDASGPLTDALETRHNVEHVPAHLIASSFPATTAALKRFDVVILSDVGSSTFLEGSPHDGVDRLGLLAAWIRGGGGLLMIGGFLSFGGVEGKAGYGATSLGGLLPVDVQAGDDRHESPGGERALATAAASERLRSLLDGCPALLGWNRTAAKPDGTVLATIGRDPLLAIRTVDAGRTAAFTSDCAPHWGPAEFLRWPGYPTLWRELVAWLGGEPSPFIA
jgi:uncharacterized membrane protein